MFEETDTKIGESQRKVVNEYIVYVKNSMFVVKEKVVYVMCFVLCCKRDMALQDQIPEFDFNAT